MLKIKFISLDNNTIINKEIEERQYNLQFLYNKNPVTNELELQGNLKITEIKSIENEINDLLLQTIEKTIKQINIEKVDQNGDETILKIPFELCNDTFIDTVGLKINFQQKIIINENNLDIFKSAF